MDRETKLDIIEMSRGYVGGILLAILMFTGIVSAMFAGECMQIDLSELESLDNVVYDVIGNLSSMEGMNITLNETNKSVSVCFAVNFAPDSFTLVFIDDLTKEVIKEIHHYRGGRTKYVYRNVTQNQTVYVPEYITKTETIEVEKIVDNTEIIETSYELWHILLALVVGSILVWIIFKFRNKKEPIEQIEDILNETGGNQDVVQRI